eukprot:1999258-Rhodomonas_salina.2
MQSTVRCRGTSAEVVTKTNSLGTLTTNHVLSCGALASKNDRGRIVKLLDAPLLMPGRRVQGSGNASRW